MVKVVFKKEFIILIIEMTRVKRQSSARKKMEEHQILETTLEEETSLGQNFFFKWPSTRSRSESESIYTPNTPVYLRSSSTPIYAGPAARIIQDRTITDLEDKIVRLDRQITILEDLEHQAGHCGPENLKKVLAKKLMK